MHDDTVTTGWRRLTDTLKGLWRKSVDDGLAGTSRAQTTCGAVALENLRSGEAIQQAARLATWEDEGGTTSPAA
jgi:hypothetical protein